VLDAIRLAGRKITGSLMPSGSSVPGGRSWRRKLDEKRQLVAFSSGWQSERITVWGGGFGFCKARKKPGWGLNTAEEGAFFCQ
ncbi:UNVERIFIED_CONTAM: hypothetical protein K2H54_037445, partial [Gekko kuhli]